MSQGNPRKLNGAARPIKTRRDYKAAASVVQKITDQAERESAAEKRLQSLIKEMEKFDTDEADDDASEGSRYAGPMRRWSDESSEPE
jgi:hypothetical protein